MSGEKILNYKNPLDFGKFKSLPNSAGRIDFDILRTNTENDENDYTNPTFYVDCSNPIPLGFVNKNIMIGYEIEDDNKFIAFDGTILERANIDVDTIRCNVSFIIHIKNNLDEEFICNLVIADALGDDNIYKGYYAREYTDEDISHNFLNLCK